MSRTESLFKYGEFQNVSLSESELGKLKNRFGERDALRRIEQLSAYLKMRRKNYLSHYAAIIAWALKDRRDNGDIECATDDYEPTLEDRAEMIHRSLKREAENWARDKEQHQHSFNCEVACRFKGNGPMVPTKAEIFMRLKRES